MNLDALKREVREGLDAHLKEYGMNKGGLIDLTLEYLQSRGLLIPPDAAPYGDPDFVEVAGAIGIYLNKDENEKALAALERIRARLCAKSEVGEWRDISYPPCPGSRVLVVSYEKVFIVTCKQEDIGYIRYIPDDFGGWAGDICAQSITQWMPLPPIQNAIKAGDD